VICEQLRLRRIIVPKSLVDFLAHAEVDSHLFENSAVSKRLDLKCRARTPGPHKSCGLSPQKPARMAELALGITIAAVRPRQPSPAIWAGVLLLGRP
jgi:hypothetical protein